MTNALHMMRIVVANKVIWLGPGLSIRRFGVSLWDDGYPQEFMALEVGHLLRREGKCVWTARCWC